MTASEVIELAFTRNISTDHIKQSDIDTAQIRYVDAYIEGYDSESEFFNTYCKPVIAFGVATDIIHRIDMELSDRGIQQMLSDGAARPDMNAKSDLRREFARKRDQVIHTMTAEASDIEGVEILHEFELNAVYTHGNERDSGL